MSYKKNYLRKDEKDEIITVAGLVGSLDRVIERYEKYRPTEKIVLSNFRKARTYARKGLEEIFNELDLPLLEQIKDFVENKEILIGDKNDVRIFNAKAKQAMDEVTLNATAFKAMMLVVNKSICAKCSGCVENCIIKNILLVEPAIEGKEEYENCPFSGVK